MDVKGQIKYWLSSAEYDLDTADAMLKTKRYLYVGFCCHLATEKILKAYFVKSTESIPPYTHNLLTLASKSGLIANLSPEQQDLLDTLTPLNIEGRYPTYRESLGKSLTQAVCEELLMKTKTFCAWIIQQCLPN